MRCRGAPPGRANRKARARLKVNPKDGTRWRNRRNGAPAPLKKKEKEGKGGKPRATPANTRLATLIDHERALLSQHQQVGDKMENAADDADFTGSRDMASHRGDLLTQTTKFSRENAVSSGTHARFFIRPAAIAQGARFSASSERSLKETTGRPIRDDSLSRFQVAIIYRSFS